MNIEKKDLKKCYYFFIGGTDVFKIGNRDAMEFTHFPSSVSYLQRQFDSRSRTSYAAKLNLLNFQSKSFRVIPWLYFLLLQEQLFTNSNMIKNSKPNCYYTS